MRHFSQNSFQWHASKAEAELLIREDVEYMSRCCLLLDKLQESVRHQTGDDSYMAVPCLSWLEGNERNASPCCRDHGGRNLIFGRQSVLQSRLPHAAKPRTAKHRRNLRDAHVSVMTKQPPATIRINVNTSTNHILK